MSCSFVEHRMIVVKELSVAGRNVLESFQFQSPYAMRPHGNIENGLNWDDGHPLHSIFLGHERSCRRLRQSVRIWRF